MNQQQFDDLTNQLLEAEKKYGSDCVNENFYKVANAANPDGLFKDLNEIKAYQEMKEKQ